MFSFACKNIVLLLFLIDWNQSDQATRGDTLNTSIIVAAIRTYHYIFSCNFYNTLIFWILPKFFKPYNDNTSRTRHKWVYLVRPFQHYTIALKKKKKKNTSFAIDYYTIIQDNFFKCTYYISNHILCLNFDSILIFNLTTFMKLIFFFVWNILQFSIPHYFFLTVHLRDLNEVIIFF